MSIWRPCLLLPQTQSCQVKDCILGWDGCFLFLSILHAKLVWSGLVSMILLLEVRALLGLAIDPSIVMIDGQKMGKIDKIDVFFFFFFS